MMDYIKTVFVFTVITCHVGMVTAVVTSASAGEKNFQKEVQKTMSWKIGYDTDGRVNKVTYPGGKETAFKYSFEKAEGAGQIERVHADGTHVTYEFDNKGRCTRMKDTHGQVNHQYDLGGNITSVQRDNGPAIQYTYDTLNRMKMMKVGRKFWVENSYDYLGRISSVNTPIGKIDYQYASVQGLVIRTLPNGVQTHWEYNPDGSLKSITHARKDRQILSQYTYSYRSDGLISEIKEWDPQGGRIVRYKYDEVQRLVTADDSRLGKSQYTYDQFANRTDVAQNGKNRMTCAYDWAGWLTSCAGKACTHDDTGNLLTYTTAKGAYQCEYNSMNRLTSVSNVFGKIMYEYDGNGNLLRRIVGDKAVSFITNPLTDCWCPLVANDSKENEIFYIWEGTIPLAVVNDGQARYFLHDHLGSVRCVIDNQGEALERLDYSSYGVLQNDIQNESITPGFCGLFFDPKTAIYLTSARGYSPTIGRFLQPDPEKRIPVGSQKDMSTYSYCGGDPVNFVDRNGAEPERFNYGWEFTKSFLSGIKQSWVENALALGEVWENRRNLEFGSQEGSFAAQAGTYGGIGAEHTVQGITGSALAIEVVLGGAYIMKTAMDAAIVKGTMLGSKSEFFHLPFLPNAIRYALGNPHYGVGIYGAHVAISNYHLYFDRLWHPAVGSVPAQVVTAMILERWDAFTMPEVQWNGFLEPDSSPLDTLPDSTMPVLRIQGIVGASFVASSRPLTPSEYKAWQTQRRGKHVSSVNSTFGGDGPHGSGGDGWDDGGSGGGHSGPGGPGGGGGDGGFGSGFSPMTPSNVGGVYLRGAGESLKNLGMLSGIAVDDKNGRLVLLSEDDKRISLPPLRMDDVVIVFRSVYEHGEAPFVSIDPDPNDPNGPLMLTRHGQATKDSYVGWVLFEADRVMKGYSLGTDNVTREKIESNIPEYRSILEAGLDDTDEDTKEGPIWERFWIVPAKVDQRTSDKGNVTLFDVPLKVMTQRMVMKDGKLEPAPNASPSQQAKDFCEWFTKYYDDLGKEALSVLPEETGITEPVSFYEELRRIALITAIAERLRGQGVPMPHWMRNYKVKPCALTPTTPAINVEATRSNESTITENGERQRVVNKQMNRIYGGVHLAAEDKNVNTEVGDSKAKSVAAKVWDAIDSVPSFSSVDVSVANQDLKAVALPGDNTCDVGANALTETDIMVPVRGTHCINLTRHFNSFFEPKGEFGTSWTLDLPTLYKQPIPVERTGDITKYSVGYQLTSLLGSVSEVFQKQARVEAVKGELLVPESSSVYWGIGNSKSERTGSNTTVVLFKDGREWHFDDQGNLVEVCEGPNTMEYRRDATGRIMQIVGWYGKKPIADIKLNYDQIDRIHTAVGSNGEKAMYEYDQEGHLANVSVSLTKDKKEIDISSMGYEYDKGLVAAVSINGKEVKKFEYGTQGRVLSAQSQDYKATYDINWQEDGVQIVTSSENGSHSILYDDAFRPVKQAYPNGAHVEWEYDKAGKRTASIKSPDGKQYTVEYDNNEKQLTLSMPEGSQYATLYDEAGRPVEQKVNGETVLRQQWHPNGLAGPTYNETCAVRPEYDQDSIQTGFMITPPEDQESYRQWTRVQYDALGRTKEITDSSGEQTQLEYDENGLLNVIKSKRGNATVKRDDLGRVTSIQSPWGDNQQNHFDPQTGILNKIDFVSGENGNHKAIVYFDESGRFSSIQKFDGGVTKLDYHTDGNGKDMVKEITTPNGLGLNYQYDEKHRLAQVACGNTYQFDFDYDEHDRLIGLSQSPLRGN